MTSKICATFIAEIAQDRAAAHRRALRDASKKGRTRRFRRTQAD